MASRQEAFLRAVAARNLVRPSVRAIVIADEELLVQRPTDEEDACYAFIGGEYEVGDSFESRLRREFAEETSARVLEVAYRFVVENCFEHEGQRIHALEHYCEVTIDRREILSRELELEQHWIPIARLHEYDLRPVVVRDAIRDGSWRAVRHLTTR